MDRILITVLLILSLGTWLFMIFYSHPGGSAVLTFNGEEIRKFSLSSDHSVRVDLPGGWVSVEVRDGMARLHDSSCPYKICVKEGWIHRTGYSIVCAPNKAVLRIAGVKENGVDAVTR